MMMMAVQSAWSQTYTGSYVALTAVDGMLSYNQYEPGGKETYDKLVDASINTKWGGWFDASLSDEEAWPINADASANKMYIIVKAESPVTPEYYFLVTANDTGGAPGRNWASWKIFGGNFEADADAVRGDIDDPGATGWTLLDDKEDEPLPAANFTPTTLEFDYAGTETFQYFWIEITKSVAEADVYLQMAEWGLGSYGDFESYLAYLEAVGTSTDEPVVLHSI